MLKPFHIGVILLMTGTAAAQISLLQGFGTEEGLCQSHVFCLAENSGGFLWIGTYNGASRWDGMSFITFDKSNGLAGNQVTLFHEGCDSMLYIGTDEGLSACAYGRLQPLPAAEWVKGERIQAIQHERDGTLYIGTARRGLLIWRAGSPDSLNQRTGLPSNAVTALAPAPDGGLIIATSEGSCRLRDGRLESLPELAGLRISRFTPLAGGGLALLTAQQGVMIYRDRRLSRVPGSEQLGQARISAIAETGDGALCCGTYGSGVFILKNGLVRRLREENGLAHNIVFALLAGRGDALYIGTVAGLSIYRGGVLSVFNEEAGIARNFVTSICEGRDRSIYFATFGGGITRMKNGTYEQLGRPQGLAGEMVHCVREFDGVLYCGTTEGLSMMRDGNSAILRKLPDGRPLRVRSVLQTAEGVVLLADSAGVCRLREGKIEPVSALRTRHFLSMDCDQAGSLYLATANGAFVWRDGRLDPVAGLPQTTIHAVRCLRDGRVCFGSDIGFFIGTADSLRRMTVREGLAHNSVTDILEDQAGRIFLLTMRGVNIIEPSRNHFSIRSLQHSDGLASDECSANSGWVDRRGRIWIGSVRGATCYDPVLDRPNTLPPLMHFERIRLFDRVISVGEGGRDAEFAHDQNYFKFDFIGINLRAPDKVRYRYRMAGVDAEWVETRERFVQYTNLDDGRYAFEVKGCNEWGIWSDPLRIRFTIHPAFWETWWFLALVSLSAAGAATFMVNHRIRRLLSIERLRSHIAADLHDTIGSGLTEIAILAETAGRQSAGSPLQVISAMKKISEISRELVDSMSDIVWLVNPQRDSLYDLLVRIKDSYEDLSTAAGISLHIGDLEQLERLHLPMAYRQNLYLLLREALTNILKHSQCRNITLKAGVHRGHFRLLIADDGIGFSAQRDGRGNGLTNMKRRAGILGGDLTVDSEPGSGTRISFEGRI
jgi:ligand-binding sensor domain-containing protein/two-component sensor histidine kinase